MKLGAMIAAATVGLALAGPAEASEALAKSSGCLTCHNVQGAKKIGPSFQDTAAKLKGKADAEATLDAKIADAKGHPKVKASADDVKKLVKWILTL